MKRRECTYQIYREAKNRRKAILVTFATLDLAVKYARQRLSEPAYIHEMEVLPLGCEALSRVGTVDTDGKVTWRRERRRPTKRYLADELKL